MHIFFLSAWLEGFCNAQFIDSKYILFSYLNAKENQNNRS